ncbi:hypothetical protein PLESTB_001445200 [Pleodorina starrii]|uniref:Peptidase M60 domain-containing protein n=1 Tax=Pleodorina starrii TaxID=330485 RepID=A0A9W6BWF0_9CHLO|nr:hypothetical protein PLESTB_001445200 [Pleodorina starrii]
MEGLLAGSHHRRRRRQGPLMTAGRESVGERYRSTTTTHAHRTSLQHRFSMTMANLPQILRNITGAYPRSAYASPYIIWSPAGFPVALGDEGSSALPVVAAVQLPSAGRVVAIGHEGIPGSCCSQNDSWDKLTINAVRWLAAGKSTVRIAYPSSAYWWASNGITGVKMANKTTGSFSVIASTVDLDAFVAGGSSNVDVYWIDTYIQYTPDQVAALVKFANTTGKGLLVGGHAWYWSYSHPNANIFTDLAINRVLWPLGLAVTTDVQTGFQPARATPPAEWVYFNTLYVTTLLTAVKAKTATFTNTTLYPIANTALNALAKSLPSRANAAASGLDGVWPLLDAARANSSGSGIGPSSPLDSKNGYPGNILDVAIEVVAIRRGDIAGLRASLSAASYPGAVPTNASRISVNITINGTYNRPPYKFYYAGWNEPVWRSTGVYAPPGQLITITLRTPTAVKQGLQVQIGAHTDDLTGKEQWFRVPIAFTRFALNSTVTTAGNPLGGLVFVLVPPGSKLGNVVVTISNVVQTPYFKLGETKAADWKNIIRFYPGPWAELDSGKFVIMLPSAAIRDLINPVNLLNHWNLVMDSMAWLANIPTDRARAERFLVDADIGGGWMHSGYPIMAYDYPEVHQEMTNLKQLQIKGAWGPYHELGHNHQWADMQFSGTGESFNNLWTMYALEKTGVLTTTWENWPNVSPEGRALIRADYFAKGAKWASDWNVWVALDTYLQLKEGFGWEFYRKMNAAYQKFNNTLPDADNVQTWIQTSSKVAGVNLVPFYTKWGFPVSQSTRNALASLPTWTRNPFAI